MKVFKYHSPVAVKTAPSTSVAREAQRLFFQIGMVQRTRIGAALTELGLTFAQAHALRLLEPDRPSPMSSLAELLVCDASNITGIADRLEARGLVERRSVGADRREKGARRRGLLAVAQHQQPVDLGRCQTSIDRHEYRADPHQGMDGDHKPWAVLGADADPLAGRHAHA